MGSGFSCVEDEAPGDDGAAGAAAVSTGLVVMGSCFTVSGSFISCLGLNLQKLAITRLIEAGGDPAQAFKSCKWWAGLCLIVSGSGLDLAALPFVPLSRIAALGASTIIANVVITPMFLGERLTKHDIIGCSVMCSGTVLACLFGSAGSGELSLGCLLALFNETLFILFFAAVILGCLALFFLIECFRRRQAEVMCALGDDAPTAFDCVWLHANLEMVRNRCPPKGRFGRFITRFGAPFYPIIHACFGGAVGSQSLMFTKLTLAFLENAAGGNNVGASVGLMFAFLFPVGLCIYLQLGYLNIALAIYPDALLVVPVYQSCWIVVGVATGLIFYKEYQQLEALNAALFGVGVLVTLLGMMILAQRKHKEHDELPPAESSGLPAGATAPTGITLGHLSDGASGLSLPAADAPFENERWYPVAGWGDKLLPTDRPQWSDDTGEAATPPGAVAAPAGCVWAGEWEAGEWEYAIDFPREFHAEEAKGDCVRRRQWRRAVRVRPLAPTRSVVRSPGLLMGGGTLGMLRLGSTIVSSRGTASGLAASPDGTTSPSPQMLGTRRGLPSLASFSMPGYRRMIAKRTQPLGTLLREQEREQGFAAGDLGKEAWMDRSRQEKAARGRGSGVRGLSPNAAEALGAAEQAVRDADAAAGGGRGAWTAPGRPGASPAGNYLAGLATTVVSPAPDSAGLTPPPATLTSTGAVVPCGAGSYGPASSGVSAGTASTQPAPGTSGLAGTYGQLQRSVDAEELTPAPPGVPKPTTPA